MGESLKEFLNGFGGRVVVIIAGGITTAFSGWAAKSLDDMKDSVKDVQTSVTKLQTNEAVRDSSRFTSTDWLRESAAISDRFHQTDVRLTQMDGSVKSINDALGRIERSLGTKSP